MTDNDKNMRTLIISFVVALMVMVPLRFVEATGQTLEATNRVLGEMTTVSVQTVNPETAPVVKNDGALEAPYKTIDKKTVCISSELAEKQVDAIIKSYGGSLEKLTEAQSLAVYNQIEKIDKSTCK